MAFFLFLLQQETTTAGSRLESPVSEIVFSFSVGRFISLFFLIQDLHSGDCVKEHVKGYSRLRFALDVEPVHASILLRMLIR